MYQRYRKNIKIEFLDVDIAVSVSNNLNLELQKWCKKNDMLPAEEDDEKTIAGLHCHEPVYKKSYFIGFNYNAPGSTILHECFHCIRRICDHHGLEKDNPTDETGAYLLGWLMLKCVEIQKQSKKCK